VQDGVEEESTVRTCEDLSGEERTYLASIAEAPHMAATARDQSLGLPVSTGHLRRAALQAKGYIRVVRIRTGRRGGPAVVIELTEKALRLLKDEACRRSTIGARGQGCGAAANGAEDTHPQSPGDLLDDVVGRSVGRLGGNVAGTRRTFGQDSFLRITATDGAIPPGGALRAQLAEALRHIDDAHALDFLPLARMRVVAPHARRFAGRSAPHGRGLQMFLRELSQRITETRPGGRFELFVQALVGGATVTTAAGSAGVTREHASRVYRPRLIRRLAEEIQALAVARRTG
jgi:hypothetical protein